MGLVCLQPPLVEPVGLPELKEYCRIDPDDTSQDNNLLTLALEARAHCENVVKRCFVRTQYRLLLDFFPGYIDLKLAGQKVSSPFVSGSNAVLVGIRYAIQNPYPPVQSIDAFTYLNANGMTTSMIVGPANVTNVANVGGQPIVITTATPLALVPGSSVSFAGNSALLSALSGQATQVVQSINGTSIVLYALGTGTTVGSGGTATGYNFVQDLMSNPARLSPIFGQVWPVARVMMNAVQLDFTCGYANPVTCSTTASSTAITSSDYTFQATDVGREISIPGAGPNGTALNTIVMSVGSTVNVREAAFAVTDQMSLIVNTPSAKQGHWQKFRRGIKMLVHDGHDNRLPRKEMEDRVMRMLYPCRDLRF